MYINTSISLVTDTLSSLYISPYSLYHHIVNDCWNKGLIHTVMVRLFEGGVYYIFEQRFFFNKDIYFLYTTESHGIINKFVFVACMKYFISRYITNIILFFSWRHVTNWLDKQVSKILSYNLHTTPSQSSRMWLLRLFLLPSKIVKTGM